MWEGQNTGTVITTRHGGTRIEERFMEVEGMIRQSADETEGIKIKHRENRDVGLHGGDRAITELTKGNVGVINKEMDT